MDVVLIILIDGACVGLEEGGEAGHAFLLEVGYEFVAFRFLAFP